MVTPNQISQLTAYPVDSRVPPATGLGLYCCEKKNGCRPRIKSLRHLRLFEFFFTFALAFFTLQFFLPSENVLGGENSLSVCHDAVKYKWRPTTPRARFRRTTSSAAFPKGGTTCCCEAPWTKILPPSLSPCNQNYYKTK